MFLGVNSRRGTTIWHRIVFNQNNKIYVVGCENQPEYYDGL